MPAVRKAKFVDQAFGPDIDSPADPLLIEAWDAERPSEQVKLARAALNVDADAIDAYNLLGIHAGTHAESVALFREAVRIGERLFKPVLTDPEMEWWGYLGTRPWMRAQHNLGLALMQLEDWQDAIAVFQRLLDLNPNDNQGIRYVLLQLYCRTGDFAGCRPILETYSEDGSVTFPATALLVDLATRKKIDFAKHFQAIRDSNEYALPMLALAAREGKWPPMPKLPGGYVEMGGKAEAALYLREFREAWERRAKVLPAFLEAYDADLKQAGKKP
ncbi:tetratricopeptide repeat protein [Rhizobium paknamense]|uniref:Tetratricopeptide (TPR) repeat protein n=1 Tax=Rhizobium paknamense TaxID=1206817 RepID=A0ABU0IC21_9HYPH|nr:tetratricopeptide repeat protein [Rhizobium paknamense]MDQ0455183.1 tetratricopeptide (TPR) repeat protein [Rhizobium paknamense]